MKIVFLDIKTIGEVPSLSSLDGLGDITYYQTTSPDRTLERVRDADIVITNKVVLNRTIIGKAVNLKLICVAATGTNNIDKVAAKERNIQIKNAVDYSSNSVAQGTFSLLLHILSDISYYDNYVKQGLYSKSDIFTHFGSVFWELNGKRFGILGLGNIGSRVAKIAEAFGCEVTYYSASGRNNSQPYLRLDLKEFLNTSDIISIHAPLNEHTKNLINYERILEMKKTAILINAGRGGIVNEIDLARALDNNLIAGAGIDVFENEPIDPLNPLLLIENKSKIVLTPHITWASIEARTLLVEKIGQNIEEFLAKN